MCLSGEKNKEEKTRERKKGRLTRRGTAHRKGDKAIDLRRQTLTGMRNDRCKTGNSDWKAPAAHAAVNAIDWRVTRMLRIAAALAALMTIGASGVSLAAERPYLGDWARGDGKTKIHVAACGAEICARNTWVKHGASGEKVGDRLILKVKPAGAGHWSGPAFD